MREGAPSQVPSSSTIEHIKTDSVTFTERLRLLVAIASYGEKQLGLLRRITRQYQAMNMHVDVVIFSDAPKDVGDGVELIVGLPSNNPWSLPFAHKTLFAQRVDRYDLFLYSEDDNDVKEHQIQGFLRAASQLAPDEIPGYLRYEIDASGKVSLDEAFGHYHWKPDSVRRRGPYTIAEFTNDHAGFYLLTQQQLRRAIASGGFLREPYEGKYDLACTAATDPYTSCGFRKVICISELETFLIHHASNRYAADHPVSIQAFEKQIDTLMEICEGVRAPCTLCNVESNVGQFLWSKSYYEQPSEELLKMVPGDANEILSIGCGWGATEETLKHRGARVTAIPLDSVIGAAAASKGINVINCRSDECFEMLKARQFDCVIVTNLLHLQPNPGHVLEQYCRFVRRGGMIVLGGPNFNRLPSAIKRAFRRGEFSKLRNFESGRINVCGPGILAKHFKKAGLQIEAVRWLDHTIDWGYLRAIPMQLGNLTARNWILQARR